MIGICLLLYVCFYVVLHFEKVAIYYCNTMHTGDRANKYQKFSTHTGIWKANANIIYENDEYIRGDVRINVQINYCESAYTTSFALSKSPIDNISDVFSKYWNREHLFIEYIYEDPTEENVSIYKKLPMAVVVCIQVGGDPPIFHTELTLAGSLGFNPERIFNMRSNTYYAYERIADLAQDLYNVSPSLEIVDFPLSLSYITSWALNHTRPNEIKISDVGKELCRGCASAKTFVESVNRCEGYKDCTNSASITTTVKKYDIGEHDHLLPGKWLGIRDTLPMQILCGSFGATYHGGSIILDSSISTFPEKDGLLHHRMLARMHPISIYPDILDRSWRYMQTPYNPSEESPLPMGIFEITTCLCKATLPIRLKSKDFFAPQPTIISGTGHSSLMCQMKPSAVIQTISDWMPQLE